MQAEQVDTRGLNKKEKGNLEYWNINWYFEGVLIIQVPTNVLCEFTNL